MHARLISTNQHLGITNCCWARNLFYIAKPYGSRQLAHCIPSSRRSWSQPIDLHLVIVFYSFLSWFPYLPKNKVVPPHIGTLYVSLAGQVARVWGSLIALESLVHYHWLVSLNEQIDHLKLRSGQGYSLLKGVSYNWLSSTNGVQSQASWEYHLWLWPGRILRRDYSSEILNMNGEFIDVELENGPIEVDLMPTQGEENTPSQGQENPFWRMWRANQLSRGWSQA